MYLFCDQIPKTTRRNKKIVTSSWYVGVSMYISGPVDVHFCPGSTEGDIVLYINHNVQFILLLKLIIIYYYLINSFFSTVNHIYYSTCLQPYFHCPHRTESLQVCLVSYSLDLVTMSSHNSFSISKLLIIQRCLAVFEVSFVMMFIF